jgi:prenyltransferase beta subunit
MISIKNRINRRILILVVTIFLLIPSTSNIPSDISHAIEERDTNTISSHTITRHQAILDYIQALYSEEGIFYGWLEDTPTDPRIGSYQDIYNVYDPYTILKQLGSTGVIDWSNCTEFLKSLVNTESTSSVYYGLVNLTHRSSPSTISCDAAIQLFPDLGLNDWIHKDEMADYIASCQTPNGGFRLRSSIEDPAEMIMTWNALQALDSIGHLSSIDTVAALNYVLSCYHDDGGFSNVPDVEAIPDIVPLGLFCLNILGRPDLIRIQNTTDYLLQYFDSAGTTSGGTLVNTERLVWSLYTLGTLDQINVTQMLSWVISCQTTYNGAFLPIPSGDIESERLEWIRAAVHILYLCDRIDLLDETITVTEYPVYHIPQWYIDYINEHFATTTNTGNGIFPIWPNIDIIAILLAGAPYIGIILLVSFPGAYIIWSNRKKKLERREQRDRRKQMKA